MGTTPVTALDVHKRSYRSAHVLWNLLNKIMKRYKMQGLLSNLSLFRIELNEFANIFNNTGGQI